MNAYEQVKMIVAALEAKGNPFEAAEVTWLGKLEESFGHTLPATFRELVAHFHFPEFDVSGVTVFSNLNDGSHSDITVAPFADEGILSWLKSHRFVQFGRPDTGSYDPVCFDLSERKRNPVVVVLDHEDILLQRKFVHLDQIAPSFIDLVNAELHNTRLQPIARKMRSLHAR